MKKRLLVLLLGLSLILIFNVKADEPDEINCDVLVVGGGTGGVAAAIQSARLNVKTCLVEETEWLGGMYTTAGVFDTPTLNYGEGSMYFNSACHDIFCGSVGLYREIEKAI